jgi:LysM repeat protein
MSKKVTAQEVITSYKKRQQWGPFIIGSVAVVLVVAGIFILIFWMTSSGKPLLPFLSTKTPTPTITNTPTPVTPTNTPTIAPSETPTPTITLTPTASGPFEYVVQEGDTCYALAVKFNADLMVLVKLNEANYGPNCNVPVGAKLLIPQPDAKLPTATPVDISKLAKGYLFKGYTVQTGDTLGLIAEKFNSTIDDIMKQNKLTSANDIQLGQLLDIRVNIVTPVPTRPATITPTGTLTIVQPSSTTTP